MTPVREAAIIGAPVMLSTARPSITRTGGACGWSRSRSNGAARIEPSRKNRRWPLAVTTGRTPDSTTTWRLFDASTSASMWAASRRPLVIEVKRIALPRAAVVRIDILRERDDEAFGRRHLTQCSIARDEADLRARRRKETRRDVFGA